MSTFPLFRRVALCSRRALAILPVRVNGEGGPTVSVAELAVEVSVAVIVVTPTAQVLARPAPLTVATVAALGPPGAAGGEPCAAAVVCKKDPRQCLLLSPRRVWACRVAPRSAQATGGCGL